MAAPKNNLNAKKDPSKVKVSDSNLNIRVNGKDMKNWKTAAKKSGADSFTEWVIMHLTREAKKVVPVE